MKHYLLGIGLMIGLLSAQLSAQQLPDFTKLVEKYSPAVVNISTVGKAKKSKTFRHFPEIPEDSPFRDFFRHFFDDKDGLFKDERPSTSLGSGFIISSDGYIVTNTHVVEKAEKIVVRLPDRREFEADKIGADERSDIALLKIDATDLPTVELGTSSDLKVGEWVLAIGAPFGFDHSATAGIVSALGRSLGGSSYVPFIQTDVAINPGNSGGPLFNLDGEVVGVNSLIYSRTGGYMGLAFAIPIDTAKNVIAQLKTQGKVSRGWLGVLIQDVNHELAESFGMEKPQGALVAKVFPDTPAEKAGFEVGDIIIKFDGKEVERSSHLPPIVGKTPVGSTVKVVVIRNGKRVILNVTIGELPPEDDVKLAVTDQGTQSATSSRLGLSVSDLDDEKKVDGGGILVQSVESGPAQDAKIRKNDIIVMINNTKVKNVTHFKEIVGELSNKTVPVLIHRGGSPLFLALKIPAK